VATVRVVGDRAIIAGHGPRLVDGSFAPPGGKVGLELTLEQGRAAAQSVALAVLGDLKRELGRPGSHRRLVTRFWAGGRRARIHRSPQVIDGFRDLMIALFGEDAAICPGQLLGPRNWP
jgi:hypothetical protein